MSALIVEGVFNTPNSSRSFHGLVYSSKAMNSLICRLRVIATTDEPVLVLGETGTGKELVARALHEESNRRALAFVPFNCSALSRDLIESRLFGHRKGAFTGAYSDRSGVIRAAEGGTVFLDEIGDLTPEAQGALLRFLQSGEVQPIGATVPAHVNVRVVAATNRDLNHDVKCGSFRNDLYFRLNVATLFLPPLRSRREDVRELILHFTHVYSKQYGVHEPALTHDELVRLAEYEWPGNVRELENYVKRRILFGDTEIQAESLSDRGNALCWRAFSEEEKRARLRDALEKNSHNVTRTARQLGISRRTVQRFHRNDK